MNKLSHIFLLVFLIASTINSQTPITFNTKTDFTTGSNPQSVFIGDLNGDGKPDLAVANAGSNSVSVFFNTTDPGSSTPSFSSKTDFTTGGGPFSVSIGDLNGDGKPDLAVANLGSNSVSVFFNTATPVFAPTTQASNVVFSSISTTSVTISWTNGNGSNRAVFVKQANTGTASPADNTTYTANTAFGSGTQIGSSGWYNVFNGTGTSVGITNLTVGTEYRVMVVEYNGSAGSEIYNTNSATNNPNNFVTTLSAPTLSSPSNGATSQALNVNLSWSSVSG
ncbi:MAG: VCBS repeat-containing protein, partial [Bacteroidetes bacterium]|nr:VCBS repeat-containing protein [Bacteroidota bacterium]